MSRVLLLFDVDGTLLLTGGASSRCIRQAARRVLGEGCANGPITVGTTDEEIFLELARHGGIANAQGRLGEYKSLYLGELAAELRRNRAQVRALPGVRELLADLSQRVDVSVGLLTGNFRRAAELKLAAAEIEAALFVVNAFAEDGRQRRDLVAAAMGRWLPRSDPGRAILIGDTPRDIACARLTGCRVLAVATGHYSLADLLKEGPDAAVEDLTRREALDQLIEQVTQATS